MAGVEALGVAAVLACVLLFVAAGPRLGLLVAGLVVIGGASAALLPRCAQGASPAAIALTAASLPLWGFGLVVLRVMLGRSVTLRLLASPSLDEALAAADERIASRVDELVRLGLAVRKGSRLLPTARGRLVGRLAAIAAGRFGSAS